MNAQFKWRTTRNKRKKKINEKLLNKMFEIAIAHWRKKEKHHRTTCSVCMLWFRQKSIQVGQRTHAYCIHTIHCECEWVQRLLAEKRWWNFSCQESENSEINLFIQFNPTMAYALRFLLLLLLLLVVRVERLNFSLAHLFAVQQLSYFKLEFSFNPTRTDMTWSEARI